MKQILLLCGLLSLPLITTAQFGNVLNRVKNKTENRANQKIDQTIDKGLDKVENSGTKNPSDGSQQPADNSAASQSTSAAPAGDTTAAVAPPKKQTLATYGKYDFVPGTKVIFNDDLTGEQLGEFPSKWDLRNGKIEIAKLGEENVIAFLDGNYAVIIPLMKDPQKDYLPEVFSIEFDLFVKDGGHGRLMVELQDDKNQSSEQLEELGGWAISVGNGAGVLASSGMYPEQNYYDRWHHCAIAYNQGSFKVYVDQYRIANLPRAKGNPSGISLGTIGSEEGTTYIKNIRIAEGGGDLYKRVTTDGRFIARGILFDVNKATLKPESMGEINRIVTMMKGQADLKFEIDGHTDADGNDAANLKLSQARAEAVKTQLVSMGIETGRLTTKGYGETKPISANTTPEDKANNRRVEFVKI
jgi:OOP family OmpA-OmpF porin